MAGVSFGKPVSSLPTAVLDLPSVRDHADERAAYNLALNHRAEPMPPLSPAQADWTDGLLKQRGLRPA